MKLTKRMQNALIQSVFLNTFFCILFFVLIFWKLYPQVHSVEQVKNDLQSLSENLQSLRTSGLDFDNLKATIGELGLSNDLFIRSTLKNTSSSFYESHFKNTGSQDYTTFLKDQEQKVIQEKNLPEYIEKMNTMNALLPFYTGNKNSKEVSINDLYFVNYVENILYQFNLETSGEIGVGNLQKMIGFLGEQNKKTQSSGDTEDIENGEPTGNGESTLQEDLYIIPLSFEVEGRKGDVLDMIHYFENVGRLEQTSSGALQVYSDAQLSQVLGGTPSEKKYNIYKNQIATISEISFPEYPDGATFRNQGNYVSLVDTIRKNQSRETIKLSLKINFYVSGLPSYKLEQTLKELQEDIGNFSQEVNTQQTKYKNSTPQDLPNQQQSLQFLNTLTLSLESLKGEIQALQQEITLGNTQSSIFEDISRYEQQFGNIQKLYETKINSQ